MGMSTAGLQWYAEVVNDRSFTALARDWKADLVRLTMYVRERGYSLHPGLMVHMEKGIELAIAHGLYVIINWAVHIPGNPNDETYRGAQDFFDRLSRKYGKYPNILYEIMSEPNGDVDWAKDLKPYAEKTVATIRANDPDGIILIGSGTWSTDNSPSPRYDGTNRKWCLKSLRTRRSARKALAIIRSTTTAGKVTLKATSGSLTAASVDITTGAP
jgi:endoglucanase